MKLKTRFFTLLAVAAAALTGCQQEEADILLPSISVSGPDLTFDSETKKASCVVGKELTTLQLSIVANRDWSGEISWDADEIPWMAVTPESGKGSDAPQRVTVTILNNAGYNRSKQLKFNIGFDYKTIAFTQTGERGEEVIGTVDNPYTVAGAIKYLKALGADVNSPKKVFVKGKISRIDNEGLFGQSGTFGNATFYISDDGSSSSEEFYAYRVLYLGNNKWSSKTDPEIQVGDEIILCGNIVNYRGNTPETVQGTGFVYEHNGVNKGTGESGGEGSETGAPVGTGTVSDPYNVAAALAVVKNLKWVSKDNYETTDEVYVKGKISRIADKGTFKESGTFGNATFYISDDGTKANELQAYRVLYLGNKPYTSGTDIQVGDEVVICGKLMNYFGNTPETVSNAAYLYSLTSGGSTPGGDDPQPTDGGTGTLADPYTPAGAAAAVKNLTWTSNTNYETTGDVYVKGKISRIAVDKNGKSQEFSTEFGNASFYISADGSQSGEFYVFRTLYLGNRKWETGDMQVKVGDEVIIYGKLMNYHGDTPETDANKSCLYSLNGKIAGGDTPGGDDPQPSGDGTGTLADPYTAVGAAAAVKDLTWTSNSNYETTGEVYVKGKISRIAVDKNGKSQEFSTEFGNASFYISADGSQTDEFYVFRTLYLGNRKWEDGDTQIKVGDEVIIHGKLMNYRGDTPETDANKSYLYSLNGKTADGDTPGGDDPQPSGDVKAVTVAEFMAAPESDTQVYELVGTIGGSISTTYGNFDLTDESGSVYVYGLTATNLGYGAENDKSYASLGLEAGDKIKIRGYRGSYKQKIEVLYPWFIEKVTEGGGGGGGEVQPGNTVSFETNSGAQTWTAATDGTYGAGFATSTMGIKLGVYKHTSTSNLQSPNTEVRVYKNSVLCIESEDGAPIKKITISCPSTENGKYCVNMAGLAGSSDATADKSALTITWTGSASKVVLHATEGQVRMTKIVLEF